MMLPHRWSLEVKGWEQSGCPLLHSDTADRTGKASAFTWIFCQETSALSSNGKVTIIPELIFFLSQEHISQNHFHLYSSTIQWPASTFLLFRSSWSWTTAPTRLSVFSLNLDNLIHPALSKDNHCALALRVTWREKQILAQKGLFFVSLYYVLA